MFNTSTQQHGEVEELSSPSGSEGGNEKENIHKSTAVAEMDEIDLEKPGKEHTDTDPFTPFDDLPEERHYIVTIRAMVIGVICGALVNASNVYLGLKTGWTFGASLFGAIIGFAVLKPLGRKLPESFPILGGDFGPRENNIVQTAATAAGGMSSVFISGVPALYQLGLLTTPREDFPRLITLTLVGGYFGFFMATPLRKFFIIYVARELKLIFPTPSATAMTIRAMHMAATGESIAKMKMRALSWAFSIAVVLRVVSQYATGILWDWHIFTWFFIWGNYNNAAINVENWGWLIEWTPAFIGAGMLVGLNTAISFYAGSILAWGIIGPTLVHYNVAFGLPAGGDDPKWEKYISFASLGAAASTKDTPSPRFWLLWPGVLLMIVVSFVELGLQYKVFFHVVKAIHRGTCSGINSVRKALGRGSSPYLESKGAQNDSDLVADFAKDDELVKWWMWFPAMVVVIILACVVMGVQFDMPVGMSLLSIFLAFFFSLLAVQCSGVTDITPLTAASKASQIVLGGATKGEHWQTEHAQRLNLLGGSLASIGADQASSLVGDFRVGYLLKTSPKQQWVAQALGTIVAVFLAPALFMLFVKAYPCIIDISAETCPFSAPSVSAWRAVAVAMTDPTFPVPTSSGIFAIVFSCFGAAMIVVRHYAYTGTWEKYRVYHPNMMCIGLSFVLPQTYYGTIYSLPLSPNPAKKANLPPKTGLAMIIGALPCYFWAKRNPQSFDIYGFAIAAGLIAGEGIGGVINAVFQVAGISGPNPYGTNIACPADAC